MTFGDDLMSADRECGAETAAYALGALDPSEAEAFRRHMASCAVCHDEVSVFGQVADALPLSAPQLKAPRGLRKRVMRAVRAEAAASSPQQESPHLRFPLTFAAPRAGAAIGVAVVAAVAVIGGVELSSGGAGSRVIVARVIGVPGSAQLRLSGGHAELIVRHLPPPPAGRIYEVWLQRPDRGLQPTSALFSVTANGAGDVGVPGGLRDVSAVLVTQEPDGGSLAPTHPPVIIARLT
jgi:hypothetical protein